MVSARSVALACGGVAGTVLVVYTLQDSSSLRGSRRLQFVGTVPGLTQTVYNGIGNAASNAASGVQWMGDKTAEGASWANEHQRDAMKRGYEGMAEGASWANEHQRDALKRGYETYNSAKLTPLEQLREWIFWGPTAAMNNGYGLSMMALQALFGVLYYCMVVNFYPYWSGPTPQSCTIQSEPAPCAMTMSSPWNCLLSWCCPQARAAHTFDRTGTLNYWVGLIGMLMCPFCTLCWANACTDLNPKLGGREQNVIASMACTWLCPCCVIAQDAESLDAATGVRTECCGVSQRAFPQPYNPYSGYVY